MHSNKMAKDNDCDKGETRTIAVVMSFWSEWPCYVGVMIQGISSHGNLPRFPIQTMEVSGGLTCKEKLPMG